MGRDAPRSANLRHSRPGPLQSSSGPAPPPTQLPPSLSPLSSGSLRRCYLVNSLCQATEKRTPGTCGWGAGVLSGGRETWDHLFLAEAALSPSARVFSPSLTRWGQGSTARPPALACPSRGSPLLPSASPPPPPPHVENPPSSSSCKREGGPGRAAGPARAEVTWPPEP